MKFEDRQYQIDCAAAWYDSLKEPQSRPVVAVPTGAGKTVIMGLFVKQYLKDNPYDRVVVLSHTQDIVKQDAEALGRFFPDKKIAIYSSGLKKSDTAQITVAGIQSAYRQPKLWRWTNLFIVDECHTVNHKKSGMYRTLFKGHKARIAGMSATVFRTGHGYIYTRGALFNKLAYDLTSLEQFNKLIKDGYLTNMIAKSTDMDMDVTRIKKTGGDYNVKQLGDRFDRQGITKTACTELIRLGKNYKKWLVFAIDTDHADNICDELKANGIHAQVLHSKMHHSRTTTTHI
jgi:DNA repair protein RadD